MSFKENLEAKIKLDRLLRKLVSTIREPPGRLWVDKALIRELLDMTDLEQKNVRGLSLYVRSLKEDIMEVLVLDILALAPIPQEVKKDLDLVSACIGGAATVKETEGMLTRAGFVDIRIRSKGEGLSSMRKWDPRVDRALEFVHDLRTWSSIQFSSSIGWHAPWPDPKKPDSSVGRAMRCIVSRCVQRGARNKCCLVNAALGNVGGELTQGLYLPRFFRSQ